MRKTIRAEIERREARRLSEGADRPVPRMRADARQPGDPPTPVRRRETLRKGDRIRVSDAAHLEGDGYDAIVAEATPLPGTGKAAKILAANGCTHAALIEYQAGETKFAWAALKHPEGWKDLQGRRIYLTRT